MCSLGAKVLAKNEAVVTRLPMMVVALHPSLFIEQLATIPGVFDICFNQEMSKIKNYQPIKIQSKFLLIFLILPENINSLDLCSNKIKSQVL